MKKLSIDLESFSSVDLSKTGVYKYVEAQDFTILLFGYSIDDGDIHVIDLAQGEPLPDEIRAALTDERVTKWAFNATFERVCLSRYLGLPTGEYLDPAQWRCSMIWSAYLGLPLSLQNVGMALGLEKQKLTEGKDLIKYFCQPCTPTKANGQRVRNLPADASISGRCSSPTICAMWKPKWRFSSACQSILCLIWCGTNTISIRRSKTAA